MIGIDNRVSDIRAMFQYIEPDPTTGMLEIVNASFIADEPIIYGTENQEYIERELKWYLSQSLYVNDIPAPVPKIWQDVASSEGKINSNYGWCVFSSENGKQFENAISHLRKDKHTRQASMIYTRPSIHIDAFLNGMKDFICTFSQQFLIRNNKLHLLSYMRSNDAVFGYKNDVAWAKFLQEKAHLELLVTYPELTLGDIIWNAASLHVYPRHLHLVKTNIDSL
jgi:thymidylate synthase